MRYFYFLLPFLLLNCKSAITKNEPINEKVEKPIQVTYQVNKDEISSFLETLASDEMEGRETGEAGMVKAADFLIDFLKKNNIKPYFKSYQDTLSNFNAPAYNVVGYLEGNDENLKKEFIVLGAHYDHIGINKNTPNPDKINNGANDDASGVTAVAEIAKYFSEAKSNKRSVLIVFFAGEEKGLLGSKHLASKLKEQQFNLYTMLNFEMIGVPMKRDYDAFLTGYELSNMAKKINDYSDSNLVGLSVKANEYKLFKRSDNYSFYQIFNVPCQTVSSFDFENFKFYHHVSDEFKLMDMDYMTSLIQKMLPVVTKMTLTPKKEIVMNAN